MKPSRQYVALHQLDLDQYPDTTATFEQNVSTDTSSDGISEASFDCIMIPLDSPSASSGDKTAAVDLDVQAGEFRATTHGSGKRLLREVASRRPLQGFQPIMATQDTFWRQNVMTIEGRQEEHHDSDLPVGPFSNILFMATITEDERQLLEEMVPPDAKITPSSHLLSKVGHSSPRSTAGITTRHERCLKTEDSTSSKRVSYRKGRNLRRLEMANNDTNVKSIARSPPVDKPSVLSLDTLQNAVAL